MSQQVKVGVIGAGRMGLVHARNLAARADVEQVTLLGRDQSRTARVAAALTAERALAAERTRATGGPVIEPRTFTAGACAGLDGLIVATPTATRLDVIDIALQAGLPLLVEKPLALSLDEQHHILGLLERCGVPCMVGFQRRFDPGYRALRDGVRSGSLGQLRAITSVNADYQDADETFVPTSGGMWRDQAIHDFDILPWLIEDEVVSVWATSGVLANPMYQRFDDVDTGTAVLEFASGVVATVLCGRNLGAAQEIRTEVYGTDGAIGTGLDQHSAVVSVDGPARPTPGSSYADSSARFAEAYVHEVSAFLDLVLGRGEGKESPVRDSLHSLQIAVAVEASTRTGARVRV